VKYLFKMAVILNRNIVVLMDAIGEFHIEIKKPVASPKQSLLSLGNFILKRGYFGSIGLHHNQSALDYPVR